MFECFVNGHRRVAVLVDENPRYKRLLMIAPHGNMIDVLKFQHADFAHGGWSVLNTERAALHYALTFRKSPYFFKTDRALCAMTEVIMELNTLDMKALVAEYNRLTGSTVSKFESKAKAIAAIEKASGVKQPAVPVKSTAQPMTATSEAVDIISSDTTTITKEQVMNTATKPAKKTPAAKKSAADKSSKPTKKATAAAKPAKAAKSASDMTRAQRTAAMTKGSGGLIIKLLKEGKLDDDSIISKVLKEFPDREIKNQQVSWYRSQLYSAGVLEKPAKK